MEKEMVTITKAEYEKLLEDSDWLNCLEQAGVDNWEGYSVAIDIRDEYKLLEEK
jgi:hypothetical protein